MVQSGVHRADPEEWSTLCCRQSVVSLRVVDEKHTTTADLLSQNFPASHKAWPLFNAFEVNGMFRKVLIPVVAAGSLLASASQVYALQEGDFAIKAGASYIKPDDLKVKMKTGDREHYKATTDEEWTMDISVLMMMTDDLGIEVGTFWPAKFTSKVKNQSYKVEYEMMPITATAQFYLMDRNEPVRPYAGLGVAFTRFSSEKVKGTTGSNKLSVDDNWGWTFQVGAVFDIDDQIFIDASARYIAMELEGKAPGLPNQNGTGKFKKSDLDPWVFSVNGGIRF